MDTKKLRQKILDLAIHGKLVPQNPNDEPASVLLERIRAEKERLIAEGKIKRSKKSATSDTSHYENVPFEVPNGWCWASLNSVCTIFGRIGFRGYTKDDLVDSTGAITLSPSNIVDGVMNYEKCTYISWKKYEESPEIQVQNEDILLVKTGSSYGKCAYVESLPKEATINPQFVVLKFIGCNPRFLTYCLQSNYARKQYEEFVLGTAIPTFTQVALGAMAIPMPPIEEQERIVAEVEKLLSFVDSLDENTNELGNAITVAKSKILDLAIHGKLVSQDPNDEPASELLKRINPKAVASCDNPHYADIPESWVECKLGEVCTFESGYAYSSELYRLMGIPLIRISNIVDGVVNIEDCVYIKGDELSKNVQVKQGDLLIAMSGATTGKIGIYTYTDDAILNQRVGNIKVKDNTVLSTDYRDLFVNAIKVEIEKKAYGGAQPNISGKMICDFSFSLPPYNEQKRIVSRVKELFSQLDMIEKSLQA